MTAAVAAPSGPMHSTMLPLALLLLISSALAKNHQAAFSIFSPRDDWDLKTLPSPNATGHLVFNTISSLLQHWPNTRYHSGHTIVPGVIPPGTLLYHGRKNPNVPTSAEWVSLDPEFARFYCDPLTGPPPPEPLPGPVECWFLTLVASQPLSVLYFDGSSATKNADGPMDTQDIVAWAAVLPERHNNDYEYERLDRMCDWGREAGFDAFISEIMLCDFSNRVQTVSLSAIQYEEMFPHPAYSFMHSSEWHDHFPGEIRVQLDLTRVVSMYDTELVPSLVSQRSGQKRRDHRVLGISQEDIANVRARLSEKSTSGSGIDWRALFKVIRDRHTKRLQVLQRTLHQEREDSAERAFRIILNMITPYILDSATPRKDRNWASHVYELCSTTHTAFAASQTSLTPSERLMLKAAQETTREICRTLVGIWAEETASLASSNISKWRYEVDRLVAWLDWDDWVTCEPACEPDESCYLPGAPFSMEKWNVSEPICARFFEPYRGLEWLDVQDVC
ncbi:J domain-containing protein [Mycena indigotica]|uniref:J domain-containing protein n=1 Tax=Mycena indigotica TaxID=2126181 RepID=A0A8H6S1M6_9AGAR|nr:J domain-containing protein [Mycena indigotica]KAF7290565.1 J domain-containing protein [Mycena indigotica]